MSPIENPIFIINGQAFVVVRGTTAGEIFTWEEAAKSTKDVRVYIGKTEELNGVQE